MKKLQEINDSFKGVFSNEKDRKDFLNKLNIIDIQNVNILFSLTKNNIITADLYGTMSFNYVIIRKILYLNPIFIKILLLTLSKIVHPNIQMYYGLMFHSEKYYIILEYINSINLDEISYLNSLLDIKEILYLKILIISRIAQTLSFMYDSECPYLMINPRNIILNYKLLTDTHQHLKVIYCENSYIETNLIKLTQIGLFLKYDKQYKEISILENEDVYDMKYHSPEMISYLLNDKYSTLPNNKVLEFWDVWSFGCLVYEIFTEINPYNDIDSKNEVINTLLNERNFKVSHQKEIELFLNRNNSYNESIQEIIKLISSCTSFDNRINFHFLVKQIEDIRSKFKDKYFNKEEIEKNKDKVNQMDFQNYHLPKFEEINLLDQQIKLFTSLDQQIKKSESEIKYLNKKLSNIKMNIK